MISFPNAKINIGLNILGKRDDGYHELESIFFPIPLCDILEIVPSKKLSFSTTGIDIPGSEQDNLCLKAYYMLREDYKIDPVQIHLHKLIPIGAGLGGGSADGAFCLNLLDELYQLNLSIAQRKKYAAIMGSDCSFFIENSTSLATGRGEKLEPIDLNLAGYRLVLINPNIHISTAEAYQGIRTENSLKKLIELDKTSIKEWSEKATNAFEYTAFERYPALAKIKNKLIEEGALYASMSGTGSTVYGFFDKMIDVDAIFPNYYRKQYLLR